MPPSDWLLKSDHEMLAREYDSRACAHTTCGSCLFDYTSCVSWFVNCAFAYTRLQSNAFRPALNSLFVSFTTTTRSRCLRMNVSARPHWESSNIERCVPFVQSESRKLHPTNICNADKGRGVSALGRKCVLCGAQACLLHLQGLW